MNFGIYISWNNLICLLQTNSQKLINFLTDKKHLLGKGRLNIEEVLNSCELLEYSILYKEIEDRKLNIKFAATQIYISGDWIQLQKSQTLEVILLIVFEQGLHYRNRFSIHGSAVAFNEKGYLFYGPKESGKTTMAIISCLRLKTKLISNDYALIGHGDNRPVIYNGDGINFITLRSNAVVNFSPSLYNKYFSDTDCEIKRKRVSPEQLGIDIYQNSVCINKIFLIGLGQSKKLEYHESNNLRAMVSLYENLSSFIRGTSLMLFDDSRNFLQFLPDFSNEDTHKNLFNFIKLLCNNRLVYTLRGSLEDIVDVLKTEFA